VRERAAAASAQPGAPSCRACLASFRVALRIFCPSLYSPSCGKGTPGTRFQGTLHASVPGASRSLMPIWHARRP